MGIFVASRKTAQTRKAEREQWRKRARAAARARLRRKKKPQSSIGSRQSV
jgi:hypothetical protein